MLEKYTSEKLLRELPRPLIHFLWYLWDTYYDPDELEFRVMLQCSGSNQRILIPYADVTVTQYFGCSIDAEIVIRKSGTRFFMEND